MAGNTSRTVSVDPGKTNDTIYWALWYGRTLARCGRLKASTGHALVQALVPNLAGADTALAIEKPIFNHNARGKRSKVRPVDIIDLAVRVGWVEAAPWASVTEYLPEQWKGQVEKRAHNRHDLRRLTDDELTLVKMCGVPPSLLNNVIDAVGIGLHHLKRKDMIRPADCPRVLALVPKVG